MRLQANNPYIFGFLSVCFVPLEGLSNNTCQHALLLMDCMQTLHLSLHLSKHVVLFRCFVSKRPSCLSEDTRQPAKRSVPPPPKCQVRFPSRPCFWVMAFILNSSMSEQIIVAHVEEGYRSKTSVAFCLIYSLSGSVSWINCWSKPAAL